MYEKYTPTLGNFLQKEHRDDAVLCLNEMIMDALEHIPDCLSYIGTIHDAQIFHFCVIPQIMAIAYVTKKTY